MQRSIIRISPTWTLIKTLRKYLGRYLSSENPQIIPQLQIPHTMLYNQLIVFKYIRHIVYLPVKRAESGPVKLQKYTEAISF